MRKFFSVGLFALVAMLAFAASADARGCGKCSAGCGNAGRAIFRPFKALKATAVATTKVVTGAAYSAKTVVTGATCPGGVCPVPAK